MIKLESIHIEEVRGIRKLDLDFRKEKFAISGPNGSGKSGVIDAIEFGLTGQIGRLTGRGTKGLSVTDHGPHVDKVKFPDAAVVTLRVFLTDLGKTATITRKLSSPNKPKIEPSDADVKAALAEVAAHPEITLSRREILRFIIVEPTTRSQEIQTILKLDEIGRTRSAFNAAQNKLQGAHKVASAQLQASREALQLHLQTSSLRSEDVVVAVNERRRLLGVPALAELTPDTKLDADLAGATKASRFNKESALREIDRLVGVTKTFDAIASTEAATMVADIVRLEAEPDLFEALQRRAFIQQGLGLVDGPECPLCDSQFADEETLRSHLKAKLAKSEEARLLQDSLSNNAVAVMGSIVQVVSLVTAVQKLAQEEGHHLAELLERWRIELETLATNLETVEGIVGARDRLASGWLRFPETLPAQVTALRENVDAKPDQTARVDAQTFLTTAQLRLSDYREAARKEGAARLAWTLAKAAHDTYCDVLEDELNTLYDEVQKDFSAFYRAINEDDESTFTAKLTPTEGSLGLDVNFYERGLFPPAAFHSEGHQDGMGVCLYLALMKRLFGDRFTFALLDDVVMSVDSEHRYQFCRLLKTQFPDTQFIVTTHDRLWAEQMKSAGLVSGKTSIAFHSWTIDSGPLVESNAEIWDEIDAALAKGKVEAAAAALRRHLEYVSRHLADQLGATPQFRADGNYELGELLPSVLKRMRDLCGKAADAAQSWGNATAKDAAGKLKATLSTSNAAMSVERWAVNRAIHYNERANFGKKDFEPVVAAFKELLGCFTCSVCDSWIYVSPRGNPEALRCGCNATNLNLKPKPK